MPDAIPPRPARSHRRRPRKPTFVRIGAYELTKKGIDRFDWRDPYHIAVGLSWGQFLLAFIALELLINVLFALIYLVQPGDIANARPGSFADALFFSFETMATVGYGQMYPLTFFGHVIGTTELLTGTAFTAVMTGLVFVRFARPKAKFLYASKAVVSQRNGVPTLIIRVANGRASMLTKATAELHALVPEWTSEGQFNRRPHELKLLRNAIPIFPLTWNLIHPLSPDSPLHGMDASAMEKSRIRLFVSLSARDPTLGTEVHDTHDYAASDIEFGMRYADAVSMDAQGRTVADLDLLSEIEPDGAGG